MNVIVLHGSHQHVFVFLFSQPWEWPWVAKKCRWLLHNKITFIYPSALVGLLKNVIYLINAQNMEHTKLSES